MNTVYRVLFDIIAFVLLAVMIHWVSLNKTALLSSIFTVDGASIQINQGEVTFALVADLDEQSKHPNRYQWNSILKQGKLVRKSNGFFQVKWLNSTNIYSNISRKNRSMELSSLANFHGSLFSVCDYTGILYRIHEKVVAYPDRVLRDGAEPESISDAKTHLSTKGMKAEWASVKDGELIIGSIGKEWVTALGDVLHRNAVWVKILSKDGKLRAENWNYFYESLRKATNTTYPDGYLWHEALHWYPESRQWIILPRKSSQTVGYSPKDDELFGSNLLLITDEFSNIISVSHLGPLEHEYGFTEVKQLPGLYTINLFMALKVREVTDENNNQKTHTKLCIFDLSGNFYTEPMFIHVSKAKYEGLAFL
eukprot:GSMAST32.ASY1.ANO1.2248.1 assembled CDS